jgi:hypothetical protein
MSYRPDTIVGGGTATAIADGDITITTAITTIVIATSGFPLRTNRPRPKTTPGFVPGVRSSVILNQERLPIWNRQASGQVRGRDRNRGPRFSFGYSMKPGVRPTTPA